MAGAKHHHLALLRGINVGGKNVIAMPALRACFEGLGLGEVRTWIASGNVLFTTGAKDRARLSAKIERALTSAFGYESTVVLRSREEMAAVIARAPRGFGSRPKEHRYDVVFLKEPLDADAAFPLFQPKEGVDRVLAGPGVIYFSRLIAKATQSRLNRIVSLPEYRSMTIRNWNTTTKLAELLSAAR